MHSARPATPANVRATVRTVAALSAAVLTFAACGSDSAPSVSPTTLDPATPRSDPPTTESAGAGTTTEPTAPTTESTTTTPPTSDATSTTEAPAPSSTVAPEPTDAPVSTELSAALTTAGSFGVTVGVPQGSEPSITTEPMVLAVTADDGRIFMQRATDRSDPDIDPTPLVSVGGTADLTPVELPGSAEGTPEDTVRIHDVATVDGEVTLLYETNPADCTANIPECIGAIMTFQPDTGASEEVASKIVFEGGWSGLELARNGLIVGTEFESISVSIFLASIGDAAVPTPADLGIEESYGDCNVCPFAYSIDPTGQFIGWVDRGDGVTFETPGANELGNQIAVVDISDGAGFAQQRLEVDASGSFGELDIADVVFGDDGFANGQAMFDSSAFDADDNPVEPVKVDLRDGRIGGIDALSASLNPNPAEN